MFCFLLRVSEEATRHQVIEAARHQVGERHHFLPALLPRCLLPALLPSPCLVAFSLPRCLLPALLPRCLLPALMPRCLVAFSLPCCLVAFFLPCCLYIRFSIFCVAFIAATVWSLSRPLVLNCLSLHIQVIIVSQRASDLPPGGMRTV